MMNIDTAFSNAREYVKWSTTYGRLPTRSDSNQIELKLNRWLNTYRNHGTPYSEVNKYLSDALGASVIESREDKSARMARMYVSFCIKNDRYPCMRLDKEKDNIRRLVNWFDSYRRGVKSNGPTIEYEKTTAILKRYLGSRIFDSDRVFKIYNRPTAMQK